MRIDQSLDSHVQTPIAYHIKYKNPYCNSQDRVHITCGPLKSLPQSPTHPGWNQWLWLNISPQYPFEKAWGHVW